MSGAFQGVHSVQLMQKELGLSFSNAGYWLGTLNQFISSDSQLTHLQNGGNNSAFAIGLEWDSPHKTLNGSDTFQELQSDSSFFFLLLLTHLILTKLSRAVSLIAPIVRTRKLRSRGAIIPKDKIASLHPTLPTMRWNFSLLRDAFL